MANDGVSLGEAVGFDPFSPADAPSGQQGYELGEPLNLDPFGKKRTVTERAGSTVKAIGQELWDAVAYHLPASVASAVEGDQPFDGEKDWKDSLIERSRARTQERTKGRYDQEVIDGVDGLGQSLGFSAVGMATGLGTGIGVGAATTAATVNPVAGAVAGWTSGTVASGAVAYRMATNNFVRDLREAADRESVRKTGKPMSDEAFADKAKELSPLIQEYGLWEAVPEAVSNAATAGIGKFVFKPAAKEAIGGIFGKSVLARLGVGTAAELGEELATETVTQIGQHKVEYDTGLYPQHKERMLGVGEALSEVAPQTVLQTLLLSGGAGSVHYAKGKFFPGETKPGVRDDAKSEAEQSLSDADRASPIPDEMIAAGKAEMADIGAKKEADAILSAAGIPATDSRVSVSMGQGPAFTGVISDVFKEVSQQAPSAPAGSEILHDEDGNPIGHFNPATGETFTGRPVETVRHGVTITMDNGKTLQLFLDDIPSSGISVSPVLALENGRAERPALGAPAAPNGARQTHGAGFTMSDGQGQPMGALPSPNDTLPPGMRMGEGFTYAEDGKPARSVKKTRGEQFRGAGLPESAQVVTAPDGAANQVTEPQESAISMAESSSASSDDQVSLVTRKDGTPFPDRKTAANAIKLRADLKGRAFDIVQFNGGFALKEKAVDATPKKAAPTSGPKDAVRFLAERGGLRDDEGHDLRTAYEGRKIFVPKAGPLLRQSGMSVDEAGLALWDAGYFGPTETTPRPSQQQVLDFLDSATQSAQYSEEDRAAVDAKNAEAEQKDHEAAVKSAKAEIKAHPMARGMTDEEINDAATMSLERGWDIEDAIVEVREANAVMFENDAAQLAARQEDTNHDFDIPFFDDGRAAGRNGEEASAPGGVSKEPAGESAGGSPQAGARPGTDQSSPQKEDLRDVEIGDAIGVTASTENTTTKAQELAKLKGKQTKLRKGNQQEPGGMFAAAAEKDQGDLLAAPAKPKWREVGKNYDGDTVYEDARGARSIVTDGIRSTESVGVNPGGGVSIPDNATRLGKGDDRYLTTGELRELQGGKSGPAKIVRGEDGMAVHITESKDKPGTFNATLRDEDAGESVLSSTGLKTIEAAEARADEMLNGPNAHKRKRQKKLEAEIQDFIDGKRDTPPEHPGLVIKSLETGRETTIQPKGTVPPKASYGDSNKVFTASAADKARALLKAKMGQLNSGLDPEIVQAGITLAGYHIEAGARSFAAYTKAMVGDLGEAIKPHLRAWYEAVRYYPGFDNSGMTSAADIDSGKAEQSETTSEKVAAAFRDAFRDGKSFKTIVEARKFAESVLGEQMDKKALEESIEAGIVMRAREIASDARQNWTPFVSVYDQMIALYAAQPILGERTSTSVENQAYSTPAPLAYLASRLAEITPSTTVYEPTAGNSMLLIDARPENVIANELNPDRVANLRMILGERATITNGDGATNDPGKQVEVVITNPPFGKVRDNTGAVKTYPLGEGRTTEIDHAISWKALESMDDSGSAVLIIGSQKGNEEERINGYRSSNSLLFFRQLYESYNVTEHFTVDGKLYARQGAAWPVDVIVIKGRGRSELVLPGKEAPTVYESWDAMRSRLNEGSLDARGKRGAGRGGAGVEQRPADVAGVQGRHGSEDQRLGGEGVAGGRAGDAGVNGGAERAPEPARKPDGSRGTARGEQRVAVEQERDGRGGLADSGVEAEGRSVSEARDEGRDAGGVSGQRVSRSGPVDRQNTEVETSLQVRYQPTSNAEFAVGTLVPRNMQMAMDRALSALEERVGDIDDFVAEKLGYSREEMLGGPNRQGYFSAEQIDALALAIDNVDAGGAFIIGDQTGVGKGRVVAGMLRYALQEGKTPAFVTKDPALYADMVRDLRDIGMPDISGRIFVSNTGLRGEKAVPLGEENDFTDVLSSLPDLKHKGLVSQISRTGNLPDGYDMLFTTYSQMQTIKGGVETDRMRALMALAPNAFVVMDESHEAGGTGGQKRGKKDDEGKSRSDFFRAVLGEAHAAMFSSATYAKNPHVMSLYFKTDLSMAVDNIDELADVISSGGVPLQQVVANMLVEAGQYVRRERSYDGVEMRMDTFRTDPKMARQAAEALRKLFTLDSDFMETARDEFIKDMKGEGQDVAKMDGAVGDQSISSTNFASTLHNIVAQMLLSIKAESTVEKAIELHKSGEKPIIALSNTNESIIGDFVSDADLKPGQEADISFNVILERYLKRLRRITLKEPGPDGKDRTRHIFMSDSDVREFGGDDALKQFRDVEKFIRNTDLSNLPASPVDYIIDKLNAAGIRTGEITGRQQTITNGVYTMRKAGAAEKKRAMNAYNSGSLDALVINKSGSTGFSLHATGKKGNDGKKRHMILLQPDPNIDVFMQMLGRIHRTGQIKLPGYTLGVSDLAVEKRPAAVLMRKLASLNANTTASKKSAVSLDNVTDFMNKYGDEVVAEFLLENPEISNLTGIKPGADDDGISAKLTGRLAILDPDKVSEVYEQIESAYQEHIESLDRMGMNALEAKTLDLDAKTVSSEVLVEEKGDSESPFAQAAAIETVDVRKLGKPYTMEEIVEAVEDELEGEDPQSYAVALFDRLDELMPAYRAKMDAGLARAKQEADDAKTDKQADRANRSASNWEMAIVNAGAKVQEIKSMIDMLQPGNGVILSVREGEAVNQVHAVVLGIDSKGLRDNPTAASTIKVRMAISDAGREVRVPLSKMLGDEPAYSVEPLPTSVLDRQNSLRDGWGGQREALDSLKAAFESGGREVREKRQIITGNLVAGFSVFKKGQFIMFTDANGKVRQGILMPKEFDSAAELAKRPVEFRTAEQVHTFLKDEPGRRLIKTADGVAGISYDGYEFSLIINTKGGNPYYLNRDVRNIVGDFTKRNGQKVFRAYVRGVQDLQKVMDAYSENIGAKFVAVSHKDEARAAVGLPPVKEEAKAQVRQEAAQAQTATVTGGMFKTAETTHAKTGERLFVATASKRLDYVQYKKIEAIAKANKGYFSSFDKNGAIPGFQFKSEQDRAGFIADVAKTEKFRVTPASEITPERVTALEPVLRKRLEAVGLDGKVALKVVASVRSLLTGEVKRGAAGMYHERVIQVAAGGSNPMLSLNHEIIHALRDMNILRGLDWKSLEKMAANDKSVMDYVEQHYSHLSRSEQLEEAVAEMFGKWADSKPAAGFVGKAYERVDAFFKALTSALRQGGLIDAIASARGAYRAMGVMQDVNTGRMRDVESGRFVEGKSESMRVDTEIADAPLSFSQPQRSVVEKLKYTNGSLMTRIKAAATKEAISESLDRWRTAMQDQFLPLLRTEAAIERMLGRQLTEDERPYLAQELSSGRKGAQLEDLSEDMVKPLFAAMHAEGVNVDELESYLYARHAPERNARISEINPNFEEGSGSGMTDDEAAATMASIEKAGKMDAMKRLAKKVDAITKFALDTRVAAGLMTEEEAKSWRDRYKHYVPLRGEAELDPELSADRPRSGSGVNVRGAESKMAFGRESRANDILAYTIMQAEEAILRAETNKIGQAFHELAKSAPDSEFWTVDKVEKKAVFNKAKGVVEYRAIRQITAEDKDYTVSLKIDGVEHRVTMNRKNPEAVRLADSMRNLSAEKMNWFVSTAGKLNRYLSTVNTSLNPEFVITNAFRDIQHAIPTLAQYDVPGLIKNVLKDYPSALKGAMRGSFGKHDGKWTAYYDEFREAGGRVYFNRMEDINELRARVEKDFRDAKPGLSAKKAIVGLFNMIEKVNQGVESSIRLSAYKNAREEGMSVAQAASLAKNLTVNFNRRGTYGPMINSLYLFYNASVQGTTSIFMAAKHPRVQKMLFAAVMAGAALEFINAMASDDDDDKEKFYDKIPDYDKSRNMIVMLPGSGGRYIKIPLPYGYNVFFGAGRTVAALARGLPPGKTIGGFGSAVADAFNPIGSGGSFLNVIAPTVADPLVDLALNKNFAGKPIKPEDAKFAKVKKPESQQYWGSVNPVWRTITDTLNSVTGGDKVKPGVIDVSPEVLEYSWGVVTGGAGAFLSRSFGLAAKLGDPTSEVGWNDIPFARRLVGGAPSWQNKSMFYERVAEIEQARGYAKSYLERGDRESAKAQMDGEKDLISLYPAAEGARTNLGKIGHAKAELSKAKDMGKISDSQYAERMTAIKEREKAIITNFNRMYVERMSAQ